jgi:tetratricopeptide (TPR) repeat protein
MTLPLFSVRMRQFAPLALIFISAVVAVCAYLQALHFPFIADDDVYIVNNQKLGNLHLGELWRFFTEPYNSFSEFLPLREISYWFDLTLFGLSPAAFRIHNILLFLLSLPLIYGITLGVWRYFRPDDSASAPWAAAAVAALFALHPSHVEAVVWIAGRKDVLSALFSLLALWLAMRARQEQGFSPAYAAAALLALAAAMLSKATAVAVAPLIAMLWLIFWRDIKNHDRRRFLLLLWPLAILLLALCIALIFGAVARYRIPFYFGIEAATRSLAVLGWLARLAVSPAERHYFHPVFEDPHLPFMVALGAAVLTAGIAGGVMILGKRSLEGFALAVFLMFCAPSMQLIPYAPPSPVSDRFLAIAAWPAILLIVALAWRLKFVPRIALLLIIASLWGFQTAERPRDWRSPQVLIGTEVRAYPGYYMPAGYEIFDVQLPQGSYDDAIRTANSITVPEARNILIKLIKAHHAVHVEAVSTGNSQKAMEPLQELFLALKQRPVESSWNTTLYNLWSAIRGKFEDQWTYLGKHFPDDALVHYNAGLWMVDVQRHKDAIMHLRAAIDSQRLPESVRGTAFQNLGLALLLSGQIVEAESALLAALKQPQPDMRIHCLLSMIYRQTSRPEEAARAGTECANAADQKKAR